MENVLYKKFLVEKELEFESICNRCGECCGSKDDPCRNLVKNHDGTFYCKDYDNRLGPQITVGGHKFNCVSIREHIRGKTLRQNCAYN